MTTVAKRGLADLERRPRIPKSPSGFVWPQGKAVTKGHKRAFKEKLGDLLDARDMNGSDLAGALFGLVETSDGFKPNKVNEVYKTLTGRTFPREDRAELLASFFGVSLADLVGGEGASTAGPKAKGKRGKKRKANGHAGNGAERVEWRGTNTLSVGGVVVGKQSAAEPAVVQLPEGAPPPHVHVETFDGASGFLTVKISGTLAHDTALAVLSLIQREGHS